MGFFEGLAGVFKAIPMIADGIALIVSKISQLIDATQRANTLKQIQIEQTEMMRTGNTAKLEERFRTGKWT